MELLTVNLHYGGISSRGCSFSNRSASRNPSNGTGVIRFSDGGRTIPNFMVVYASGKREVELLEKELKFEPMFDGYLKDMEVLKDGSNRNPTRRTAGEDSVGNRRIRRVKTAAGNQSGDKFRQRGIREAAADRSNEKSIRQSLHDAEHVDWMEKRLPNSGEGWEARSVGGKMTGSDVVSTKNTTKPSVDLGNVKNGNLVELGEYDKENFTERKRWSRKVAGKEIFGGDSNERLKTNEMQSKKQYHDRRNNLVHHDALKINLDRERTGARNNGGLYIHEMVTKDIGNDTTDNNLNKLREKRSIANVNSSITGESQERGERAIQLFTRQVEKRSSSYKEAVENNRFNLGVTNSGNFISQDKQITAPKKVSNKTASYDIGDMERAAFRTFEVFTDVKNRPRVLRMELEERIQKLAKWLNGTDINVPQWQFSKMLHSAKIKFTDHSILRIVQILGELGNWRRALQVVEWLQSREHFESYKSRYIYTTVLSVLGKARRPVETLNIFHSMRQQLSSYPDMAAYHCIAVTLGQAGHLKELFDVIDCMRAGPEKKMKKATLENWDPRLEPDLVVYNAILNACIRRKHWEGAFWVLQQLKQRAMQPSSTTYGLVMEVMLECGKYKLVHEFFKKIEKSLVPNTLTYRVLVNAFWKEGKIEDAVLAVQDMERRGIVGSASLYYDLARCLCSAGRCQDALLQVDKICKVAKKPLVVTYTGLIKTCIDCGSIENAKYIFNHMKRFCSPNLVTYNMMLKGYVEERMFRNVSDLFWEILEGSESARTGSDSGEPLAPDSITFTTMLKACVEEEKWDEFERVYQRMLRYGLQMDVKRHLCLILEASKAGKGHLVETAYNQLVQSGRVLPPSIIKERFCWKLQQEDCFGAIACISGLGGDTAAFSKKAWLVLFKENAHRLQRETLLRLLDILATEGDPTHPVIESSLREFIYSNTKVDSVANTTMTNTEAPFGMFSFQ